MKFLDLPEVAGSVRVAAALPCTSCLAAGLSPPAEARWALRQDDGTILNLCWEHMDICASVRGPEFIRRYVIAMCGVPVTDQSAPRCYPGPVQALSVRIHLGT